MANTKFQARKWTKDQVETMHSMVAKIEEGGGTRRQAFTEVAKALGRTASQVQQKFYALERRADSATRRIRKPVGGIDPSHYSVGALARLYVANQKLFEALDTRLAEAEDRGREMMRRNATREQRKQLQNLVDAGVLTKTAYDAAIKKLDA